MALYTTLTNRAADFYAEFEVDFFLVELLRLIGRKEVFHPQ